MSPFSLVFLPLLVLICYAVFGHAVILPRAPRTSYAPPAQYANSTTATASSVSPSTVSNATGLCTGCTVREPGYRAEFNWPIVDAVDMVLATVIYKVDPNNVTSTIMRYNNATGDPNLRTTIDAAQWNKILGVTGVTVENDIPHFNYITTVYSAPGKPFTVSSLLTSPQGYTNWGWLYHTVYDDDAPSDPAAVASGCLPEKTPALSAMTPTATPPGYTNPYDAPLGEGEWYDLIPSDVKEKCPVTAFVAPQEFIRSVRALTETSTESQDTPFSTTSEPTKANPSPPAPASEGPRATGPGAPAGTLTDSAPLAPTMTADKPQLPPLPPSQTPPSQPPPPSQLPPSDAALPQSQQPLPPSEAPPPDASLQPASLQPEPVPPSQAAPPSKASPISQAPVPSSQPGTHSSAPPLPPDVIIGTQTLIPGSSAITVSGVPIFIGSASAAPGPSSASNYGSFIISDLGGTQASARSGTSSPPNTPAAPIVVDTQTLTPGAPAVTVSGTPVSLASVPTAIVIGTNTIPVGQTSAPTTSVVAPGLIVINSQTLTPGGPAVVTFGDGQTISFAQSSTALVVGTQTILPGAPGVTISGTPISLASIPTAVVIGTNTIPVSHPPAPPITVAPGPLVIGSQTLTPGGSAVITLSGGQTISFAHSSTALVVGTQTVLPGSPGVTISGTEYSLAPSGTAVVVDGETIGSVLPSGTRTASGLSPTVFTGVASRSLPIPADWQRVMALFSLGGLLFAI